MIPRLPDPSGSFKIQSWRVCSMYCLRPYNQITYDKCSIYYRFLYICFWHCAMQKWNQQCFLSRNLIGLQRGRCMRIRFGAACMYIYEGILTPRLLGYIQEYMLCLWPNYSAQFLKVLVTYNYTHSLVRATYLNVKLGLTALRRIPGSAIHWNGVYLIRLLPLDTH